MRNIIIIFLIIITPVYVSGQSSFATAVEYNDYIVSKQTNIGSAINTLIGNIDLDCATVMYYYHSGLGTTKVSMENIKKLKVDFFKKIF